MSVERLANFLDSGAYDRGTTLALVAPVRILEEERQVKNPRALLRSSSGSVTVEYTVILGFVGLATALLLVTLGPRIVKNYADQRAVLYGQSP